MAKKDFQKAVKDLKSYRSNYQSLKDLKDFQKSHKVFSKSLRSYQSVVLDPEAFGKVLYQRSRFGQFPKSFQKVWVEKQSQRNILTKVEQFLGGFKTFPKNSEVIVTSGNSKNTIGKLFILL